RQRNGGIGLGERRSERASLGAVGLGERAAGSLGRTRAAPRLSHGVHRDGLLHRTVRREGQRADDGRQVDQDGRQRAVVRRDQQVQDRHRLGGNRRLLLRQGRQAARRQRRQRLAPQDAPF